MLCAAHVAFALVKCFVIDITPHPLAPHGTEAARYRVPAGHRALHGHTTPEPKDPSCDSRPNARCSRRNAFAPRQRAPRVVRRRCCVCRRARRACHPAPSCRSGSAAQHKRWPSIDLRGAQHGPAFTPDRQIRRCRDGGGGCRRSICKHTKTGRRQVRHATARAPVGTLSGATLLFLQARLNSKNENNNKPANVTRRFRTQG
jgi:hypothetical protein